MSSPWFVSLGPHKQLSQCSPNTINWSDLNKLKPNEISKSSILPEETDSRKLKDIIDEKDRHIRKQQQKIKKLEEQLRRVNFDKNIKFSSNPNVGSESMHLQLLKTEIIKTNRLEEIIEEITDRINVILEELSHDNTITENSEEIKQMILMLEAQKKYSFSSITESFQFESSLNISDQWAKALDILEGVLKSYKNKFTALSTQNKALITEKEKLQSAIAVLQTNTIDKEELRQMSLELKEQKKQKEKIKRLLEKSELQKNELLNKINTLGLKQGMKAKTMEQLIQYSKELNYRIKDLQNEKALIIKESTREKQDDLKKYQDFLKRLKIIKQKSILGKSYG